MCSHQVAAFLLVSVLGVACVSTVALPSGPAIESPSGAPSPSSSPIAGSPVTSSSAALQSPAESPQPIVQPSDLVLVDPTPASIPSLPPPPGWPRLAGITSTWQGGCGAVFFTTEEIAGDDCGPFAFRPLLASTPIRVVAGSRLVLRSADGSSFSMVAADLPGVWTVKVASAAALANARAGPTNGFPSDVGAVLARGRGPDTAIIVTMPTRPGDYVVQIESPIVVGRWTFAEGIYFWLIRVV